LISQPYLSIVTISRNDEHGGDPQRRTQIFIDSYAWQAEHYKLETELILVDWNPPQDKPGLADILVFPANDYFYARVIVVPPEVHEGFRYSNDIPLFQFIGKNAGIRRARGEFILATCMDSVLDDRLFEYIAKKRLDKDCVYRADLYDIKNNIPDIDHNEQQAFCRNPNNEDKTRTLPQKYRGLWDKDRTHIKDVMCQQADFPWVEFTDDEGVIIGKLKDENMENLNFHNNGDFHLAHRDVWNLLHGYGEFEAFSWHIDSLFLLNVCWYGFTEANFAPPLSSYHIAHGFQRSAQSAFVTTEDHLSTLAGTNIPIFCMYEHYEYGNASLEKLINLLKQTPHTIFNDERWGLRNINLEEYLFEKEGSKHLDLKSAPVSFKSLSAIKPEFYFERFSFEALFEKQKEIKNVEEIKNANRNVEAVSKADRVVNKLRSHRIIWFILRIIYKIIRKLYKIMKTIKIKLLSK